MTLSLFVYASFTVPITIEAFAFLSDKRLFNRQRTTKWFLCLLVQGVHTGAFMHAYVYV